jgi:tetratricopeptide (TPR) repeat protein
MNKETLNSKLILLYFFIFLLLLLWTYSYLILKNPILNYDDFLFIAPIRKLTSFKQYFTFLSGGQILDVQPVRDLSFFIINYLNQSISVINFHSFNVIYWFISCLFIFKIFETFLQNLQIAYLFTFLIAFSPVSTSSVAWISAQKHILSTMFILMATWLLISKNEKENRLKNSFFITILYSLAVFSHPINLLWPFWGILYLLNNKIKLNSIVIILLPAVFVSFFCFYLNYVYYNTTFIAANAGVSKLDPLLANDYGARLLALGRYTFLIIFPFDALPTPHYIGSIQNILGIAIFVVLCFMSYLSFKKEKSLTPFLFLIYFLFPLTTVLFQITRVFCSDTYLLNAGIGIYLFIGYYFIRMKKQWFKFFLIAYAAAISIYNSFYINAYKDSFSFWKYSYQKEANPDSGVGLADAYMNNKNYDQAELIIKRLHDWQPDNMNVYGQAVRNIFLNPSHSDLYKIKRLSHFTPQKPITHFFLSILYYRQNNMNEFKSEMTQVFSNVPDFLIDFGSYKEKVIGTYLKLCELSKVQGCKEEFDKFKLNFKYDDWDYKLIERLKNEAIDSKGIIKFEF